MRQKIRWFLLVVGILMVVTISLQNRTPTQLNLLLFESTMPLTLLLLATSAASFIFGALTTVWMLRRPKGGHSKSGKASKTTAATPDKDSSNPLLGR